MEEKIKYPIYARTNASGIVTKIFSTAFEQPTETDTLIDSENTDRHGANRYKVFDDDGIYNYVIKDGKLAERDKTTDLAELEKNKLRQRRDTECFPIVNRGESWRKKLTEQQKAELDKWYDDWCDVTDTYVIPERPKWLSANGEVLKV